jgi:hypothetical protein
MRKILIQSHSKEERFILKNLTQQGEREFIRFFKRNVPYRTI